MNLTKSLFSLFVIAFVLCFSSIVTFAQEPTPIPKPDPANRGESYTYKYSGERAFDNTPSWDREGEPPISISQAVKIARENIPRFVKHAEIWKFKTISLQMTGQDKWFYNIAFFCSEQKCFEFTEELVFAIIVKMDGTILEPKKIKLVD